MLPLLKFKKSYAHEMSVSCESKDFVIKVIIKQELDDYNKIYYDKKV